MSQEPQKQKFLLPLLKEDSEVQGGTPGQWRIGGKEVFEKVAKSLYIKDPGEDVKSVSSIPNMWARALSMEMPLHAKENKLRSVMVPQWEGMLAAIALADIYDFKLRAKLVDLITIDGSNIGQGGTQLAKSLRELAPSVQDKTQGKDNNLYQPAKIDNPWHQFYVFLWKNQPVGATSPSTLVYPSEDGDWTGLPWWSETDRKLLSPRSYITDEQETAQLWLWLDNIIHELLGKKEPQDKSAQKKPQVQKNEGAINSIIELIREFQNNLGGRPQGEKLTLNQKKSYFKKAVNNHGPLIALNYPISPPERPSNVKLITQSQQGTKPAVIYAPDLLEQWGQTQTPQRIWIHHQGVHTGVNYLNIHSKDIQQLKRDWENEVKLLEPDDLLLPESDFHYIVQRDAFKTKEKTKDGQERVVMDGGLLPSGAELLKNQDGDYITPLLPLNPVWLDYFTAEELIEMMEIEIQDGQAKVTVRLTLSGMAGENREYLLQRQYPLQEENGKTDLPVLEVWPNFIFEAQEEKNQGSNTPNIDGQAGENQENSVQDSKAQEGEDKQSKKWQEYYAFYSDGDQRDTFAVDLAARAQDSHQFQNQDRSPGKYQIFRLTEFPSHIPCQDTKGKPIGLILLPPPDRFTKNKTEWTVGVDFGTSFTQVCIQRTGQPEPLSLTPLSLSVTASKTSTRSPALYEFFLNETAMDLPLSSILTTRGTGGKQEDIRPLLDGRIYIPSNPIQFNPLARWIATNLKWSRDERKKAFLNHLALLITAQAAREGAGKIQWALSYPTAYSENYIKNFYQRMWQELTEELQQTTRIEQVCPTYGNSRYYLTESLSLAKYFDGFPREKQPLDLATCIDVGGATSDISIWQDSKLLHQCSVKFAGRDLFSRILERYPDWLSKYFKLPTNPLASSSDSNSDDKLSEDKLDAKLDALLRENSKQWLKKKPDEERFFQEFRQLMAIGWAGLYYYIGILLKVLHQEPKDPGSSPPVAQQDNTTPQQDKPAPKYSQPQITPVYLGGNGSRLLHWLEIGGQFYEDDSKLNLLFSRMIAAGSGFEDRKVKTKLSQKPKEEVAIGLVLDVRNSRLEGLEDVEEDILIAGEAYKINDQKQKPFARMQQGDYKLNPPDETDFETLPQFLYQFNLALKELKLTIPFLEETVQSPDQEVYQQSSQVADNLWLWREVNSQMYHYMSAITGEQDQRENDAPFTLALKSLIDVLAQRWAAKWKKQSPS